MSVKVVKDTSQAVLRSIQELAGKRVLIGIPANKTARKGEPITNAALGYIHEHGSPAANIPPRPFLKPGMAAASACCAAVLKTTAQQALAHPFDHAAILDKGLQAAGLLAQASVKTTIQGSGIIGDEGDAFAPLKKATLLARRRKGVQGSKPLLRTGQLMNSITYVVVKAD